MLDVKRNASLCYGPVAQRIRQLTSNQGIAGSSPARVVLFSKLHFLLSALSKADEL